MKVVSVILYDVLLSMYDTKIDSTIGAATYTSSAQDGGGGFFFFCPLGDPTLLFVLLNSPTMYVCTRTCTIL